MGCQLCRCAWLKLGRAGWGWGCHAMCAGQGTGREVVLLGVNRVGTLKGKGEIQSMAKFFGSSIYSETSIFSANTKGKILFK